MPSKAKDGLSNDEIWDDTALIRSWDDALEEYKVSAAIIQAPTGSHRVLTAEDQLYHSIHARGERVEDVLMEATNTAEGLADARQPRANAAEHSAGTDHLEEGEVQEAKETAKPSEIEHGQQALRPAEAQSSAVEQRSHEKGARLPASPVGQASTLVTESVQEEALHNLMMAWYYAGYYTGLYQGREQAQRSPAPNRAT